MWRLRRVLDLSSPSGRSYGSCTAHILLRQLLRGGWAASTVLKHVPSLLQTKRLMACSSSRQPALAFPCHTQRRTTGIRNLSLHSTNKNRRGKKEKRGENESDSLEGEVGRITCVLTCNEGKESEFPSYGRNHFQTVAVILLGWLRATSTPSTLVLRRKVCSLPRHAVLHCLYLWKF